MNAIHLLFDLIVHCSLSFKEPGGRQVRAVGVNRGEAGAGSSRHALKHLADNDERKFRAAAVALIGDALRHSTMRLWVLDFY